MGATVTTGQCASAFRAQDGRIIYVLFEETYEENCFPHTPYWACIGIGEIKDTVRRIFKYAASCEGGMLQNRSGRITPEGYIRSWMQELASPVEFRDSPIVLSIGDHYSYAVETEKPGAAESILSGLGRTDIIETLQKEKTVRLTLFSDLDVVLALYGLRSGIFPAWRVIDRYGHRNGERNALLGFNAIPAPVLTDEELAFPRYVRVSEDEHLVENEDGSFSCAGWAYSIVGEYVETLWEYELQCPRSYVKLIKAFRDHVHNAPRLALDRFHVLVDITTPLSEAWQKRSVDEFRETSSVADTATGFEAQVTEQNFHLATYIPTECSRWILTPGSASV